MGQTVIGFVFRPAGLICRMGSPHPSRHADLGQCNNLITLGIFTWYDSVLELDGYLSPKGRNWSIHHHEQS